MSIFGFRRRGIGRLSGRVWPLDGSGHAGHQLFSLLWFAFALLGGVEHRRQAVCRQENTRPVVADNGDHVHWRLSSCARGAFACKA
ncbi:hypothetical protein B0G84_7805 [Paraburkholderia sp. BL8N3]|nr:hypothetical protein B0G84_7805 [Paraburkholderia sp. BL8N3]